MTADPQQRTLTGARMTSEFGHKRTVNGWNFHLERRRKYVVYQYIQYFQCGGCYFAGSRITDHLCSIFNGEAQLRFHKYLTIIA